MKQLKQRGIQCSVHFHPIHFFTAYQKRFRLKPGLLPLTEEVSQREVSLPLFPGLGANGVETVVSAVNDICQKTVSEY